MLANARWQATGSKDPAATLPSGQILILGMLPAIFAGGFAIVAIRVRRDEAGDWRARPATVAFLVVAMTFGVRKGGMTAGHERHDGIWNCFASSAFLSGCANPMTSFSILPSRMELEHGC